MILDAFRQTDHVRDGILLIMRVPIALSIVQLLHQLRDRIADLQRDRLLHRLLRIVLRPLIRAIQRVGFRRQRKVGHRMGQMHAAFRHAQKMRCLIGRHTDLQRTAVGHAYILAGKAHQPSGDIQRILSRFQHARQPVHRGLHIAVAHRFVQRGDEIIMLFALFVI